MKSADDALLGEPLDPLFYRRGRKADDLAEFAERSLIICLQELQELAVDTVKL